MSEFVILRERPGLVVIALGALAKAFALGPRAASIMMWSWVYTAYSNWFGSLLGAITGASRLTPIAGAGTSGSALAEGVVMFFLLSLAIASVVGTSLAVWGFRQAAISESGLRKGAQRASGTF